MIEALYLHIPFCASRCCYCDFATQAEGSKEVMTSYADDLSIKLRRASRAGLLGNLRTIYLGGGTPTHLGSATLNSLVYLMSLSINLENVEEFTIECNPESLTQAMVKDLFALGVDRFSIGVQSFDPAVNAFFGRAHSVDEAEQAIKLVQERCDNVSVDLICGAPGQDMESWMSSLCRAVELGVKHISVYPLTVEEGTPLDALVSAGACPAPDEGLQADMMLAAQDYLAEVGMRRYEVASYAYEGFESKHNHAYWSGVGYLGLGRGASSMMDVEDFERCSQAGLFDGLEEASPAPGDRVRLQTTLEGATEVELLNGGEALLEDVMLAFRKTSGLSGELAARACRAFPQLEEVLSHLEKQGLIQRDGTNLVPTQRGWLMGNELYGAIWCLPR